VSFFDLREGCFVYKKPIHKEFIDSKDAEVWNRCIQLSKQEEHMNMKTDVKERMLAYLLLYYQIHLDWNNPLKSYEIIKEIFA
jgi:hypothetical protein